MADSLLPIYERIAADLVTTLENVTTAAGFNSSLIVERAKPSLGNRRRDSLAVLVQGKPMRIQHGDEGPSGQGPAYGHDEWLAPFAVVLTVFDSEDSPDPVDRRMNIIRADVEKALVEDCSRGGLAIDTIMDDPEELDGPAANAIEWAIPLIIHYRTLTGQPYTA